MTSYEIEVEAKRILAPIENDKDALAEILRFTEARIKKLKYTQLYIYDTYSYNKN
jgi:hypothetical protein